MKKSAYVFALICIFISCQLSAKEKVSEQSDKKDRNCELISNQDAINQAEKISGGKVVSIKLNKKGDSPVYKVRVIIDDKRVKNLSIKACKG